MTETAKKIGIVTVVTERVMHVVSGVTGLSFSTPREGTLVKIKGKGWHKDDPGEVSVGPTGGGRR